MGGTKRSQSEVQPCACEATHGRHAPVLTHVARGRVNLWMMALRAMPTGVRGSSPACLSADRMAGGRSPTPDGSTQAASSNSVRGTRILAIVQSQNRQRRTTSDTSRDALRESEGQREVGGRHCTKPSCDRAPTCTWKTSPSAWGTGTLGSQPGSAGQRELRKGDPSVSDADELCAQTTLDGDGGRGREEVGQ